MFLPRLLLALVLNGAFVPLAHATAEIVIKFSHVVASNTPKGRAAQKFKELAEQKTAGKVQVQLYPNSQLYKDHEEMEALQINAVQMLAPSLSKFGALGCREFELFDLPYIFPSLAVLHRTMDGEIGQQLFKKLENKNIVGLAYWDNGFKHFSANKPLRKLEDFKGIKMRIQSSKVLEAQMKVLGANPQPVAFSEVYSALQNRVVDGTESPVSNFYSQKLNQVQKYLLLTQHGYLGYGVIANKTFWQGLPSNIRRKLMQALQEATQFERDISEKENAQALKMLQAANTTEISTLSLKERERLYNALLPVHKEFEKGIVVELIHQIYAVAAEVDKQAKK